MEMNGARRRSPLGFSLFLVLLLILSPHEESGMIAEARDCESQSQLFKGLCVSSGNCANVCHNEGRGFTGGNCRGLRRRCFCTKPC